MTFIARQQQSDGHWSYVALDEDALEERVVALEDAPPPEVDITGDINAVGSIHATGNITSDGGVSGVAVSGGDFVVQENIFLWASIAPADEEIASGQVAIHYDQYTGKLYLRGRLNTGELFSKTLAVES